MPRWRRSCSRFSTGGRGRHARRAHGDHGESLGEHGEKTHGLFAYDATLRVPLIVYEPRLSPRAWSTIRCATSTSCPPSSTRSGCAAARARRPQPAADRRWSGAAARRRYFEALSASLNRGWAPLYGVARGSLKYIDLPIPELYDLAADPAEAQNLMASRPDDVRELQRAARQTAREPPRSRRHARTPIPASGCAASAISPAPRRQVALHRG